MKARIILQLVGLMAVAFAASVHAQPTAFTYQGQLRTNGVSATGFFDMQFGLYDGSGPQVGPTLVNLNVGVSNGLFTTLVDFGVPVFDARDEYLEIAVRPAGAATLFQALTPRQLVSPTPKASYAYEAGSASNVLSTGIVGQINDANLSPNIARLNSDSQVFTGALTVGSNLNVGGTLTVPAGQIVKSVNGMRDDVMLMAGNGLVLESNRFRLASSGITITDTTDQPFGLKAIVPSGSFVKVGLSGVAGDPVNTTLAGNVGVQGESMNGAGVFGVSASANPFHAGVRGHGHGNTTGVYGYSSSGRGVAGYATGGGSAVYGQNASASGFAGDFAGHVQITEQLHFGSVTRQMIDLWGGQYGFGVQSGTHYSRTGIGVADRFAWYQGGTHSDTPLDPGAGGTLLMSLDRSYLSLLGNGNEQPYIGGDGAGGDIEIGSRNAVIMNVGFWNSGAGSHMNVYALSFTPTSDRNAKENFKPVNAGDVLKKVVALPLSEWNYKQDKDTRHIGPMAQDFHAAFGVGPDDKHIATVDAAGVALAAIQGLNQKVEAQRATLEQKETEITELRAELQELKQLVSSLAMKGNQP